MGCVVALEELQRLQAAGRPQRSPAAPAVRAAGTAPPVPPEALTPLQLGETLAALCTLGCPHPLWRELAIAQDGGAHDLVLKVPLAFLLLTTHYSLLTTHYSLLLEHDLVLKASSP
eukprot:scaffold60199_cov49-Phaeocystis_antarctica.AAC.2